MFQRILVPVDGSSRAEQAVLFAARLARATGGSLVLLRVITHARDAVLSLLQPPEKAEEHLETQHAQAIAYLTHLAKTSELTDLRPALEIADSNPEQTILSSARLQQVDRYYLVQPRHNWLGALGTGECCTKSGAPEPGASLVAA